VLDDLDFPPFGGHERKGGIHHFILLIKHRAVAHEINRTRGTSLSACARDQRSALARGDFIRMGERTVDSRGSYLTLRVARSEARRRAQSLTSELLFEETLKNYMCLSTK